MPDPMLILKSGAAAVLSAAVVLLFCAWPWRKSHPARTSIGWVLGVAMGFSVGCWLLGLHPNWPPREDQDRLLLILFPALIGVELLGSVPGRIRSLIWLLRLAIAAGAARILLHDTSYLEELAGLGSREWTPAQTWMILGALAAALAGVWALLAWLARRAPSGWVALSVALACAGAAITVMLSGYASGGQIGLPLAGALIGALAASLVLSPPSEGFGGLSLGIVGLFTLLVIGRFFGQLATSYAILLFAAPLLSWLPQLLYTRRLAPQLRGLLGVILTAAPVAVALILAQQKFVAESKQTSPGSQEPSLQDYLDFGQ
jgi:hypothetical protein